MGSYLLDGVTSTHPRASRTRLESPADCLGRGVHRETVARYEVAVKAGQPDRRLLGAKRPNPIPGPPSAAEPCHEPIQAADFDADPPSQVDPQGRLQCFANGPQVRCRRPSGTCGLEEVL